MFWNGLAWPRNRVTKFSALSNCSLIEKTQDIVVSFISFVLVKESVHAIPPLPEILKQRYVWLTMLLISSRNWPGLCVLTKVLIFSLFICMIYSLKCLFSPMQISMAFQRLFYQQKQSSAHALFLTTKFMFDTIDWKCILITIIKRLFCMVCALLLGIPDNFCSSI